MAYESFHIHFPSIIYDTFIISTFSNRFFHMVDLKSVS